MMIKYNLFKCSNDIESKTSYDKHISFMKAKGVNINWKGKFEKRTAEIPKDAKV